MRATTMTLMFRDLWTPPPRPQIACGHPANLIVIVIDQIIAAAITAVIATCYYGSEFDSVYPPANTSEAPFAAIWLPLSRWPHRALSCTRVCLPYAWHPPPAGSTRGTTCDNTLSASSGGKLFTASQKLLRQP